MARVILLLISVFATTAFSISAPAVGVRYDEFENAAQWRETPIEWVPYSIGEDQLEDIVIGVLRDPAIDISLMRPEKDLTRKPAIVVAFRSGLCQFPGKRYGLPVPVLSYFLSTHATEFTQIMVRIYERTNGKGFVDVIARSVEQYKPGWGLYEIPDGDNAVRLTKEIATRLRERINKFVSAPSKSVRPMLSVGGLPNYPKRGFGYSKHISK